MRNIKEKYQKIISLRSCTSTCFSKQFDICGELHGHISEKVTAELIDTKYLNKSKEKYLKNWVRSGVSRGFSQRRQNSA